LSVCISCGSKRVERKRIAVRRRNGRIVSNVDAEVCAACGERYYDLEAMRKLERGDNDRAAPRRAGPVR
jgi:YgiT-type zinc finger domain-containing protein